MKATCFYTGIVLLDYSVLDSKQNIMVLFNKLQGKIFLCKLLIQNLLIYARLLLSHLKSRFGY